MYIIYIFLNIDYFIFDYISTAYNVHIVNHTVFSPHVFALPFLESANRKKVITRTQRIVIILKAQNNRIKVN